MPIINASLISFLKHVTTYIWTGFKIMLSGTVSDTPSSLKKPQ